MYFYIFIKLYRKEPTGYTLLALVVDCAHIKFVRGQQNWAIKFGNGEYFYSNKVYHFFKIIRYSQLLKNTFIDKLTVMNLNSYN